MTGVCNGECLGYSPGDEPLTWTRCYNCGLLQLYETLRGECLLVAKPMTLGYKGVIFFSFCLFCIFASVLLSLLSWHYAC